MEEAKQPGTFKKFVPLFYRKKHDSSLLRLYKVLVQQERTVAISFLVVINLNGLVVIRMLIRKEAEVCPFFIKGYKKGYTLQNAEKTEIKSLNNCKQQGTSVMEGFLK